MCGDAVGSSGHAFKVAENAVVIVNCFRYTYVRQETYLKINAVALILHHERTPEETILS